MSDLKHTIAANISALRKKSGMTQLGLAEKLNYSDKAVSKWESGASVPDVGVLKEIAGLFGVSVDWLLEDGHADGTFVEEQAQKNPSMTHPHRIITMLSVALVWLISTACYVFLNISGIEGPLWLSFIWALPVSSVVLIVLNSVWGIQRKNYVYISILVWTLLGSIYLTLLSENLWLLFVMGIPGEAIIVLWAGMKKAPHAGGADDESNNA